MAVWKRLKNCFKRRQVDDDFFAELRATLLAADIGPTLTNEWMHVAHKWKTAEAVERVLREQMFEALRLRTTDDGKRTTILVVGVNGVGKTTTIAKLAHHFKASGSAPMLVAGDTFRAAAIEQLQIWGQRLEVPVIAQQLGSDAAAVAFDGIKSGIARGCAPILIDTAGRLHTKVPLMDELIKIKRVCGKAHEGAPDQVWCILDAMTGQNAIAQVQQFHEALGLTGFILTKLDGTAKAGAIFQIAQHIPIPILFAAHGEQLEDLAAFQPETFVTQLLDL